MTKEDKISEIIKHYPTQKIGLDDFYGKQTVINMLNEAINFECSSKIKAKVVNIETNIGDIHL